MRILLEIWRQRDATRRRAASSGTRSPDVNEHMSFLEMLDVLNRAARRARRGAGRVRLRLPRGDLRDVRVPRERRARTARSRNATICQTHMRHFRDGDVLRLEPWRAAAFPVREGPRASTAARSTGSSRRAATSRCAPGARPRRTRSSCPKPAADRAMEAAACIGCGACVAACPNASAALFTGREGRRTSACCRRVSRSAARASSPWRRRRAPRGSATARPSASARRSARPGSSSRSSRG